MKNRRYLKGKLLLKSGGKNNESVSSIDHRSYSLSSYAIRVNIQKLVTSGAIPFTGRNSARTFGYWINSHYIGPHRIKRVNFA